MKLRNYRIVAVVAMFSLLVPSVALATGGSGSKYETQQGGEIEFYENGQVKKMKGNAKCTGVKVTVQPVPAPEPKPAPEPAPQAEPNPSSSRSSQGRAAVQYHAIRNGAAYGHIAIQVPLEASVASLESYTDATLSTPLMVNGELVVWNPNAGIAAEAEAFAGPAQPGFVWRGFRTNPLLEGVAGSFAQNFTWSFSYDDGSYPDPGMIGTHSVAVYVSDNAQDPDPLLEWHVVY